MQVKYILSFVAGWLLAVFGNTGSAQSVISGQVVDKAYGGGLGNCNVFINNTGIGTRTDSTGHFIIREVPPGKYNLVISYVGFETVVYTFDENMLPLELTIPLQSRARELPNVVLEPYEEGDYQKWKLAFLPNFIGSGPHAGDCRILNPQVLRFRYYLNSKRLQAWSDEPLEIENNALGYLLTYQLEQFELDMKKNTTYFLGFMLFRDMQSDKPLRRQRWLKNREEAYNGSLMHFMRSVWSGRVEEEGFSIRRILKAENLEKKRIGVFYKPEIVTITGSGMYGSYLRREYKNEPKGLPKDSLLYYRTVILGHDTINKHSEYLLTADSLVMAQEGAEKVLYFGTPLFIQYKRKTGARKEVLVWSMVNLPADKELHLRSNGMYYDARDLISGGEWSESERIAGLLPWDYGQ